MSSRKNPGSTSCRRRLSSGQVPISPSIASGHRPLVTLQLPDLAPAARTSRFSAQESWIDSEPNRQLHAAGARHAAGPDAPAFPTTASSAADLATSGKPGHTLPLTTEKTKIQRFTTAALIAVVLFTVFVIWDRHRKLSESSRQRISSGDTERITHLNRDSFGTAADGDTQRADEGFPDAYREVAPVGAMESLPRPRQEEGRGDPRSSRSSVHRASFEFAEESGKVPARQTSELTFRSDSQQAMPQPSQMDFAGEATTRTSATAPTGSTQALPAAQATSVGVRPFEPRRLLPRTENNEHAQ